MRVPARVVAWFAICTLGAACDKVVDVAPDAAPSCTDGVKNGDESDVDCGGTCDPCGDGKFCNDGPDCANNICNGGSCAAPSCSDNVHNGDELDVDCAGTCGAGTCKTGQRCDDNTQCESQMCAGTNVCISPKRVFITTGMFTGSQIGGLAGADAKCQQEADAAGLGGTYKAWLSDLTGSPSTRFTRSAVAPYVRTDGFVLAANWEDLVDGTIGGPINRTAGNQAGVGGASCGGSIWVFTNTLSNGNITSDTLSCTNWTSDAGGSNWGRFTDSTSTWSSACTGGTTGCAQAAPLYCFEQ